MNLYTATFTGGSQDATVEHTIGHTNYVVFPEPTEDNPTLSVASKTETSFVIHTASFNTEETSVQCAVILSTPEPSGDAPYGSLTTVKRLCSIDVDDTSLDTALNVFMNKACDFIDSALTPYESSLPLSSVPDQVGSVAEFYAAGLFLQKDQPDEKPHPFISFAQGELSKYINRVYGLGSSSSPFVFGAINLDADSENSN